MSLKVEYIKISCKLENSKHVFIIDLEDKKYYKEIFYYEVGERSDFIESKNINKLTTKEIINYFDKLKDIKEFEITDYVISAKYTIKEYENFKRAVWYTVQKVKKKLKL